MERRRERRRDPKEFANIEFPPIDFSDLLTPEDFDLPELEAFDLPKLEDFDLPNFKLDDLPNLEGILPGPDGI